VPTDLHLALQDYYAGKDGELEAEVEGYKADVLRDGVVYEVQTGSFVSIRDKLDRLCAHYPVVLVHPVAETKIVVRVDPETGVQRSARRSPKHGSVYEVFDELVYMGRLLRRRNLSLEIVLTVEREYRCDDGKGSWRRKGVSLVGRELVEVLQVERFNRPTAFRRLLPTDLPKAFTVRDLMRATGLRYRVAGRMVYALREMGAIKQVGKQGNALVYAIPGR